MTTHSLTPGLSLSDPNLVSGWRAAARSLVPVLIAEQAAARPDAPALASHGRTLSYAEMDARANALATRIVAAVPSSDAPVAIYFESSIELVIAALAAWKAGRPYLPIDPAYPAERAAFILTDSGASVLLGRPGVEAVLPAGPWTTLIVDDAAATPIEAALPSVETIVASTDLAYIIYTSGSTGQPKGVEITHGNLLNLVDWHVSEFSVNGQDRATQIAGPGFDAAVWECWPYLTVGAAIHIPSADTRLSSWLLRDWLVAEQITVSFVPTVLAEQLLQLPWPEESSLRFLLTGGDALHSFPPAGLPFVLVNNYGPTECTVVATSCAVTDADGSKSAPAIGRAIFNTSIFLLDEAGQPVGEGEVGEMYIAGASVGRGYRNRPDLTAAGFVQIKVDGVETRAFRTGDLARMLPDGQYTFVGRADDQIKIRGFRIEPDEIACVLNQQPGVTSSAVIARSDRGEKRLVAYLVAAQGAELRDRELREALTRQLPEYMVPSCFVLLNAIPVTPNGKLDKAALPAPAEKNQLRQSTYVGPRNEVEEIVEGILAPILGLEQVSIHDNFFLLGGHSLMGAQVIAKVRDVFDVELILRNVFECPTVAKLSARIEAVLIKRLESMSEDEVMQALSAHAASAAAASNRIAEA